MYRWKKLSNHPPLPHLVRLFWRGMSGVEWYSHSYTLVINSKCNKGLVTNCMPGICWGFMETTFDWGIVLIFLAPEYQNISLFQMWRFHDTSPSGCHSVCSSALVQLEFLIHVLEWGCHSALLIPLQSNLSMMWDRKMVKTYTFFFTCPFSLFSHLNQALV